MLTQSDTPVEKYIVSNRIVFVKRDDLYGVYPAPQLGKLRGLKSLLNRYHNNGERLIGCWDTRVSYLGQGVAAMCNEMHDMKAIISYPALKGHEPPQSIKLSQTLNAEIFPIRGNHVSICYSQVKRYVEGRGGVMLPFGLECQESVDAIAKEANNIEPDFIRNGSLILCCGSGVTLSGILNGLKFLPKKVVGVSSGRSIPKILACLKRYCIKFPEELIIEPARIPYYETLETISPFPTHPNYDLKAWRYLEKNIDKLPDPVMFWNIGS